MTTSVAFVVPSFVGGGAERVALSLLAGVDRKRFRPSLVVLNGRGALTSLVPIDIPVTDLRTPRLRNALPGLATALRALRPAAVFSTFGYVNLALLALRSLLPSTKIVVREANLPSLSLPHAPFPRLLRLGYRRLYSRADCVIATSRRMAEEMRAFGVSPSRLTILPNPVDIERVRTFPPRRHPGEGVRLVAAGRLTKQKGFDVLPALLATFPQAHLTILGEGPERSAIMAEAIRWKVADRMDLPGFDPEPWGWYAGADVFLMPSLWEGMPNAALEALACGTPVLATPQSGGIAELVEVAASGSVVLAEIGEPFIQALAAFGPSQTNQSRPSRLPEAYHAEQAQAAFNALLTNLVS